MGATSKPAQITGTDENQATVEIQERAELGSTCSFTSREALVIDPAKTCQPIGAVYASLGFHNTMPISHGSQGCLSYLRMALSRHFREPITAVSTSFAEGTAVFGGGKNLREALKNVIAIYRPEVLAIHTTCVAETIGDDVKSIVDDMKMDEDLAEDTQITTASTPSYQGSHITGYDNMVHSFVETFGGATGVRSEKINVIPGFVGPADIREIKRLLEAMGIEATVFPDQSGVLDSPLTGENRLYQKGGTPVEALGRVGDAAATFALGKYAGGKAARSIERKFDVPAITDIVPLGLLGTDELLLRLSQLTGKPVPESLTDERGRLVDMITDAHPHWHGKSVAIFGDPDMILGLAAFVASIGMVPRYVLSGSWPEGLEDYIKGGLVNAGLIDLSRTELLFGADLRHLEELIKQEPVDLLIGNTYGKLIARKYDIPLVRVGFPIMDRANLHHFPVLGYAGAADLIERIGNTLLDKYDRDVELHLLEMMM